MQYFHVDVFAEKPCKEWLNSGFPAVGYGENSWLTGSGARI